MAERWEGGGKREQFVPLYKAGMSDELRSSFEQLQEAASEGVPRYPWRVVQQLLRTIVCRNYEPALYRLGWLLRAIPLLVGGRGAIERFFWESEVVRPAVLRQWLMEQGGSDRSAGAWLTEEGIEVAVGREGEAPFLIRWSQLPLLSALMEFMVAALGYREMVSVSTVPSEFANHLSRKLYQWLKGHLDSAQQQQKFLQMVDFLRKEEQQGEAGGEVTEYSINDERVMALWEQLSPLDDSEFKRYETVYNGMVRLYRVLRGLRARQQIEPCSLSGTGGAGGGAGGAEEGKRAEQEVDSRRLYDFVESLDEEEEPLQQLFVVPCSRIKFLNKREAALAQPIQGEDRAAIRQLSLSRLRCLVFGRGQNRLVEAERKRVQGEVRGRLIEQCAVESYRHWYQQHRKLSEHLQRLLLATHQVLQQQGGGRSHFARAGFRERDLQDPEVVDGFAQAVEPLLRLKERVEGFQQHLQRLESNRGWWESQLTTDRARFAQQFDKLYGEVRR